ncbi:hypothetical protein ASPSYDRAFT_46990 [Aspergillus sydowii CBS 593.65]|uniref:HNH domain-containing protein n=1 Tax=Aspergillus sydowii CBS 593.65 TaxID=1036612 RepID=A0A1L9TEB6_9EURO|nr:uncharacterized protein ASPSYDRAFT_46990 [Aspergillus sydowii CBS 593.65]OJJ57768.1 hypothetical protein ASPSYDRAFT_46990 [Aspergillus sydowii CBS 593.65]
MASSGESESNYAVFRECVSSVIIARSNQHKPSKAPKRRLNRSKKAKKECSAESSTDGLKSSNTAGDGNLEELADYIDFIAAEIFTTLPGPLQSLSYSAIQHSPALSETYSVPLSPSSLESLSNPIPSTVTDTLSTYTPDLELLSLLNKALTEYIPSVTRPPPVWVSTRAEACEICERDWIPLSYHHLIPRGVHDKAIKKGWHDEWMLNSVAWLCRACHSFVHRMASNEELAREWFTVERILEREDVKDWAKWVGRVRWKAR